MKPEADTKDLFKGAFILTIAAFIIKILSAVYRVPFQNIVGDVGFYIYQQVYPFYGIALVLSTYGFPVVISKLYAEQRERSGEEDARGLLAIAFIFLFALGLMIFAGLFFGSEWVAAQMGDPQLALLLKVISFVFLLFPFVSMFRGYFQGTGNMVPTAVSQVAEQFVRVATILAAAAILMKQGASLYDVGGGAVLGSVTGGFVAVMVLAIYAMRRFYFKDGGKNLFSASLRGCLPLLKALMIQGFAISISGLLLILFQMADSLNLYSLLLKSGLEGNAAKELKGVYDRGQPLIQLGTVVATAMSLSLIPVISSEKVKNKTGSLVHKIRQALQVSVLIGVAASLGLLCIIRPTNQMLFENSAGSNILAVLCMVILFGSAAITLSSILQGLGQIFYPAVVISLGFGMKFLLNMVLVPHFGIIGAAYASVFAMAAILILMIFKVRMLTKTSLLSAGFFCKTAGAAAAMVIVLTGYIKMTDQLVRFTEADRLAAAFQAGSAVLLGAFIYLGIVIRSRALHEEELLMLPFGSKLIFLLPKKNRRRNG